MLAAERLAIEAACTWLAYAFCQFSDRNDYENYQGIFTADAVFSRPDAEYRTAAAIAALYTPDAVEVFQWESAGGTASAQQANREKVTVEFASQPKGMRRAHSTCTYFETSRQYLQDYRERHRPRFVRRRCTYSRHRFQL